MKISINAIREQGYEDLFKLPIDQLAEKISAQLGALEEEPYYLGKLYEGILVAKVLGCDPHPNADKLKVCKVDIGKGEPVEVVCGAPNVKEGMVVAYIPPGTTVPATVGKDPLVLEAREIRGVTSNGMLASASELGISDNHDGILEIKAEDVGEGLLKPGTPFKQLYGLDDHIIEIENKMFTHRPDLFGMLGVGRELAGIQGKPFKSPDWYQASPAVPTPASHELQVEIKNELPELVSRFVAIPMSGVKVQSSPVWLQTWLTRLGLKSINNVVDLTNYYMMQTGQPLHAYDYDKVKALSGGEAATIVVRNPHENEKLQLLNGKTIDPKQDAIMIATDKQLIGVGGIMGGSQTEVDENTQNIILEVANFDMYSIRRTAMFHGLFTDAGTRFTKGQSPLQNLAVALKAADDLSELTGGKVAGAIVDVANIDRQVLERGSLYVPVTVTAGFINQRLGLKLSSGEMKKLLENVEFEVSISGEELSVTAPFWRTDIELREDVVEEIGRLYGYDHLPLELPPRDLTPAKRDPLFDAKASVRIRLSRAGANEILTYTFVPGDLLEKTGQDPAKAYQVANALSPDLQYYRLSLMPSLLEKIHPNIKAGYDEFALFEIGKTHGTDHVGDDGLPQEFEFTGLVLSAADKLKKPGSAYYGARKYLEYLARGTTLVYKPISDDMLDYPVVQPYERRRAALVSVKDGSFLGIIGEFKPSVISALKLPKYTAGFEIDTSVIGPLLAAGPQYKPLSRFPKISQDITLSVPGDLSFAEVTDFINQQLETNAPEDSTIQLEPIDIYKPETDKAHNHVTFRVTVTPHNRTLTDKAVSQVLDALAKAAADKLKAERV